MQLSLDRSALLRALIVTARVVERRSTIPILSNVRLAAEGKTLAVRATDLDIEAASACPAAIDAPGALTVPAHMLTEIVRKLPDGAAISLRAVPDKGQVIVSSGRARFTLSTLPVEDYPDLQAGELPHRFEMSPLEITRLVGDLQFAISSEETRYYLNGIYLHAEPEAHRSQGLIGVATDGHRLARLRLPLPEGADGMPGVILPRKFVDEWGKLAQSEGSALFTVELSPAKIRVSRDETVLTSKLIDGTFPDYRRVIPSGNAHRAFLDGRTMAAALERVMTVSNERGRAVKLSPEADRIRLSQVNPDAGEAHDEVDAGFEGTPPEIGFNGKYLAEILGLLDSETVEILFADPGSPTILRRRDDELLTIVLMPMRV